MCHETVWISFMLIYLCFHILEYFYDNGARTDEDADPTFSEDEALTQRGLRRSQSVKITRSRVRKDVRLPSLTHTSITDSFSFSDSQSLDIFYIAWTVYKPIKLILSAGSLWIIEDKRQEEISTELRKLWNVISHRHTLTFPKTHIHRGVCWLDVISASFTAVNFHPD